MKKRYKAAVNNDQFVFDETELNHVTVSNLDDNTFHVLSERQVFQAKLIAADFLNKTYKFAINGNTYEVKLADEYDQLLARLGFSSHQSAKVRHIKAPMPGLVLSIAVEAGQTVHKGDSLLILEAMKMENIIKSPNDGVIRKVSVAKGDAVDKGQVLLEFE